MQADLEAFLSSQQPVVEEQALWGDGSIRLRIICYLSAHLPPSDFITSVRSIVVQGDNILVMRDIETTHILPGGRREADESLGETLRRELLEETGWEVSEVTQLGFMHFHHLTPRPQSHIYPYPDFLQVVYVASAVNFVPGARVENGYELEAEFRPLDEVHEMDLSACQYMYLNAALKTLQ